MSKEKERLYVPRISDAEDYISALHKKRDCCVNDKNEEEPTETGLTKIFKDEGK